MSMEVARDWLFGLTIGMLGFFITYSAITIVFPGPSVEEYVEKAQKEVDKEKVGEAYENIVQQHAQALYQQAWSSAQQMNYIATFVVALIWLILGFMIPIAIVSMGCTIAGIILIPYGMLLGIGLNPAINFVVAAILFTIMVAATVRRK